MKKWVILRRTKKTMVKKKIVNVGEKIVGKTCRKRKQWSKKLVSKNESMKWMKNRYGLDGVKIGGDMIEKAVEKW